MKISPFLLVALLALSIRFVEGATGFCGNPDDENDDGRCRFEQTMTCEEMIESYEFKGDACALSADPVTDNCLVTICGGSCAFYDRCRVSCAWETCTANGACVVPYTHWSSQTSTCRASEYDVSNLQYDEECPYCTCCPDTDSQGCLASSSHEEGLAPNPDSTDADLWWNHYYYSFVRTHSPELGDLGSADPALLDQSSLVDVEVSTSQLTSASDNDDFPLLHCTIKIGTETCQSCTPCDPPGDRISADCTNVWNGRNIACEAPESGLYPLVHPPRCTAPTTAAPTPKKDIDIKFNFKPHITFSFDSEVDAPGAPEILILIEQIGEYIRDTLMQEGYDVKDVHLDKPDSSFTPSSQVSTTGENAAAFTVPSFEISFMAKISLDVDTSPSGKPSSHVILQALISPSNLNSLINQYAPLTPEGDTNGSFEYISTLDVDITGFGEGQMSG